MIAVCKDLDHARQVLGMNRPIGAPLLHRLQWLAAVLDELVVDDVDLAARRQDGDQAWNGVHDQPRLAFAFAQGFFCPTTLRNLLFQQLVRRGEFTRSPSDAFIEAAGESLLLAQEARVLQADGRLVRGDIEKEPLRV